MGGDIGAGVNGVNSANGTKGPATYPSHPLGPLSGVEITQSSRLVTESWPEGTLFQFKSVKLREPAKKELVPYLTAERAGGSLPSIDRRSDVLYYIRNTVSQILDIPRLFNMLSYFRINSTRPSST